MIKYGVFPDLYFPLFAPERTPYANIFYAVNVRNSPSAGKIPENTEQKKILSHSEHSQTSKVDFFTNTVIGFQPLPIFAKNWILNV